MQRRLDPECLDRDGWGEQELRESLRLVSDANRGLGGVRWLRQALDRLGKVESLLDVGTGNADLMLRLSARSGRVAAEPAKDSGFRGWVGVDLRLPIARVAAERTRGAVNLHVLRADGRTLPFADDAFDVVVSTLTLHHFGANEAVAVLREMGRVARRRVMVADLERSRISLLGARVLSVTLWRSNALTRVDGPLSVQKAFTRDELGRLARRAGLRAIEVRRRFPSSLLLEAEPEIRGNSSRAFGP